MTHDENGCARGGGRHVERCGGSRLEVGWTEGSLQLIIILVGNNQCSEGRNSNWVDITGRPCRNGLAPALAGLLQVCNGRCNRLIKRGFPTQERSPELPFRDTPTATEDRIVASSGSPLCTHPLSVS